MQTQSQDYGISSGIVDEQFSRVREQLEKNYQIFDELGSAVCVIVEGRTVVDLVAGWKNKHRSLAWNSETLVNVWSSTKGVVAICFAMLVDDGLASYDDLVVRIWREWQRVSYY